MRRLDRIGPSRDGVATFLRLQREARGLALLRAQLPANAPEETVRRRFRWLRGIGRRRSGANGETEAP